MVPLRLLSSDVKVGQRTAAAVAIALVCGAVATGGQAPSLTVDRIASLPSLIGTAPSSPEWSPDSSRLAFLWNDSAMPFRDVWIVAAGGGQPRRLTDMAKSFPEPDPPTGTSLTDLMAKAAARTRGGVGEILWAPDGQSLLLGYRGDIFRINADGQGLARVQQGGGRKSSLAFSPDGRFLSFLQNGDLWLWDQARSYLVRATRVGVPTITTVPSGGRFSVPDVEFSEYQWSPDGRHVALQYFDRRNLRKVPLPYYLGDETSVNLTRRGYPGDEEEIRALAIYSVADGELHFVDLPDRMLRSILAFGWSPDGKSLYVEQDSNDAEDRWFYLLPADGRSVRPLWHDRGERRIYSFFSSRWRSDGQAILFISDADQRYRLASLPLDGRPPTPLTTGDWDVVGERGAPTLGTSPKTKEIFFVSTQKSPYERQVARMPEAGGAVTPVTTLAGVHQPFVSPDGSKVALLHSNDVTPTELYIVDAQRGGAEQRITQSPPKEFYSYKWVQPRYVTFKSRVDNYTLHGRIVEPPNLDRTKKYPVVLGSVYSNTVRNEWRGLNNTLQQFMAQEGEYINLQVDIRGSVGYGRDFREIFQGDWGGNDIEDLHSGVEYLKTLPYVDGSRIGIWGSSYGGTLTTFALFKKPGLFKAGVAGAPAVDVAHFTVNDMHLSRRPQSHPWIFKDGSSLNLGEQLQDRLLIIHGMQDDVVPFRTSVMLAEKLMLLGKDFDFAFAPTAVHGWSQREHYAVFFMRKLVEYFDRFLGPGGRAASAPSPNAARER